MKRAFSIMLVFIMAASLTACGNAVSENGGRQSESSDKKMESTATTENVANTENTALPTPSEIDETEEKEELSVPAPDENRTLVAYFSLAGEQYEVGVIEKGNTQIVAEMIAEQTGADLFAIEATTTYPDTYNGLLEASREEENNPPQLAKAVDHMDSYDVVFVGYPIWWGDLPAIVEVFLQSHDFTGKTIIPFCTHGGSGLSGTQSRIKELCAGADVKDGLAIKGSTAQNDTNTATDAVTEWLANFREAEK